MEIALRQLHPLFVGEVSGVDTSQTLTAPTVRAIWDNRCTMHRGRPFDETQTRDLRRVTTRDVPSTIDQVA
jgi:hypothetical protein